MEPSFPPCEEYQQNGYLPAPSEYYERPKDPGFSNHDEATYQRSNYTESNYDFNATSTGLDGFAEGGHVQTQSGRQNSDPLRIPSSEGVVAITKDSSLSNDTFTHIQKAKEPVVYPWMKKVHVNTGKLMSWFMLNPSSVIHPNVLTITVAMSPTFGLFTSTKLLGQQLRTLINFIALFHCLGHVLVILCFPNYLSWLDNRQGVINHQFC